LLSFAPGPARFLVLVVPIIAIAALSQTPGLRPSPMPMRDSLNTMAAWADTSTWGSSLFLFPDADRASYPGVFRAQSRHGLWADWNSARGVAFSETASARWQERWLTTMQNGFSPARLEGMLTLPIDYYVLNTPHELQNVRRAFINPDFVVYDAEDLRNAPKPLRLADGQ